MNLPFDDLHLSLPLLLAQTETSAARGLKDPFCNPRYLSNGGAKGDAREQENVIATGKLPAASDAANKWVTLSLAFAGDKITPSVDGKVLKAVTDSKFKAGMVGLGSGWNTAWFDDLSVAK